LSSRPSLRILIVEDEILIALELECLLQDAGHDVVGIAASSAEAIALAEEMRPDLAFVDIDLVDGPTGVDVARRLTDALNVTVLFMTANAKRIPEDFAGAKGVISKPYTEQGVRQAIAYGTASGADTGDELAGESATFAPFSLPQQDENSFQSA
jgi:two-component system, response regulator PdtaR